MGLMLASGNGQVGFSGFLMVLLIISYIFACDLLTHCSASLKIQRTQPIFPTLCLCDQHLASKTLESNRQFPQRLEFDFSLEETLADPMKRANRPYPLLHAIGPLVEFFGC